MFVAPACFSISICFGVMWDPAVKPTTLIPALRAAMTPAGESSTTKHCGGGTLNCLEI